MAPPPFFNAPGANCAVCGQDHLQAKPDGVRHLTRYAFPTQIDHELDNTRIKRVFVLASEGEVWQCGPCLAEGRGRAA